MRRIRQVRVISNECPFLRDIHRLMQIILSPVVNIVLSAPPTPWGHGRGAGHSRGRSAGKQPNSHFRAQPCTCTAPDIIDPSTIPSWPISNLMRRTQCHVCNFSSRQSDAKRNSPSPIKMPRKSVYVFKATCIMYLCRATGRKMGGCGATENAHPR